MYLYVQSSVECSEPLLSTELLEGEEVEFDFLGKDSIRYYNRVKVDQQVPSLVYS